MIRLLVLALAIGVAGTGEKAEAPSTPTGRTMRFDLKSALDAQIQAHGSNRWRTGIAVYSCSRKSLLYDRNANKALSPASCQKLMTTACALEHWDSSLVRTLDTRLDSSNLRAHIHRVNRKSVDSLGLDARPDFPGYRHLVLANRESDNSEAEWMLQHLSRSHKVPAWKLMSCFLDEREVSKPGLRMWDACGLSHRNRVAPVTLAELLVTVYESQWRDLFISTLAVPGRPGTLVKRALDVGPHLAAKTGYIRDVFSLSGFLFGQTDTFAFSFIVNGCGSGTRAYEFFNSLLNTVYRWNAGETLATTSAAHTPVSDTRQN
jgi:D-alanyl-D-alanine carboxypeptidase